MIKRLISVALFTIPALLDAQSSAPLEVNSAWVRPTVAGQMGTGAFMRLASKEGARVVGVSSEVAGVAEIHEMAMHAGVMTMRAMPGLDLEPGKPVELKPGGYHIMLMDLKRPLSAGEKIKVDLRVETRDKKLVTQPVEVEVRQRAP
ncbi:MAG: copper chaperone PCu(A)C [Burkholderiaceae bacterium]